MARSRQLFLGAPRHPDRARCNFHGVRKTAIFATVLAVLSVACGDAADRGTPPAARFPSPPPPPRPSPPLPGRPVEPLERLEAAGRAPLELAAASVEGHPPLPTYRATVRNVSDRPVRRVIATVVYLDAKGRTLPGENHDVAFGSPLQAIDPGVTLETSFLSRVDRAPGVRLVARVVTFLEKGTGADPVPREWPNPRYAADLAQAEGRR
jgi:hypothetical protein